MAKYRDNLPQLGAEFFMTDGGIETTLIFLEGQDLPDFAAFHLFRTAEGVEALRAYFLQYCLLANRFGVGLVLETPTWRASADWAARLGYPTDELAAITRRSVELIVKLRDEYETIGKPIVISGCLGPRGDGYVVQSAMSVQRAADYHQPQIDTFAGTSADLVTAITMNYTEEAVGITRAAKRAGVPVVISFTLETDGNLPTGQPLRDAVRQVDDLTGGYPAYFMINCAHPDHFDKVLTENEPWVGRLRGLRANASRMSHAELNDATELDTGNTIELANLYATLKRDRLRDLNVMGGCCGTDVRHIEQIAAACLPLFSTIS